MKLLYCIPSLIKSGGTERVLTTKANYLAEHTDNIVHIFVESEKHNPYFKLSNRIICHFTNHRNYRHRELFNLIEKIKPDVIIALGDSSIARLHLSVPTIYEFHYTKNFLVNFVKGIHHIRFRFLHLLKCYLLQKKLQYDLSFFTKVVLLTKRDLELWHTPRNMCYIPNPLSFRSLRKADLSLKRIIGIGSFTPAKGFDRLIVAFAMIAKEFPDWRVDIFGSGQDEAFLRKLISENQLEKQVFLNVALIDVATELCNSSIYAFPSRSDGFGLVLTEAMECGLPSVAFDCECGPREILSNNCDGFLIPQNDIKAFAESLRKLMKNEDMRKRFGEQAIKNVVRFYPENILPQWLTLFQDIIEGNKRK